MPTNQPTVAGRDLGAELRLLREARNISSRKVAERLGWAQSKISRIETGKQSIKPEDVASLLALYDVIGRDREYLIEKASRSDESGLVEKNGGQGSLSRESRTLIHLEAKATAIYSLEMLLIPGLLQTPEYTRALLQAFHAPGEDIEVRVAARMGRQAILTRDKPPRLEFIIDEGALRRQALPSKLMARQLRHLTEAAERPNVSLRVLSSQLGAHSGLDGPFTMLEFGKNKPVVHVEHKISGLFMEEEYEVTFFREELDNLRSVALSPQDSVDLIASMAKDKDEG
ncbi:helix-turn-helix transcriptional regulator [Streptomonospora arabica]|uniref:Helix-turn-helix domain-containing protein n=1 Tax=Streptomonospora arabica TaxID=412417 RepID=A0ABV9STX7_9ACTN